MSVASIEFIITVTSNNLKARALSAKYRNFSLDKRVQRSFVFKFDYFTIVGEGSQPMPWQQSDTAEKLQNRPHDHIPISRCCSVVALSLSGDPVKRLRNNTRKARKEHTDHGNVYDPWAPVRVFLPSKLFDCNCVTNCLTVACTQHSMLPGSATQH